MVDKRLIQFDPVFQSQIRLGIVAALFNQPVLDFKALKELTGATDGNLSTHMQKLEGCGYIHVNKRIVGRKPKTSYSLTERGKDAFISYVESLEQVLKGDD